MTATDSDRVERIGREMVRTSLAVQRELGPGPLESAYRTCLAFELTDRGLAVEDVKVFSVSHRSVRVLAAFRIDMLVEDLVLIENETVQALLAAHNAQMLTYLKLSARKRGSLMTRRPARQ